jgi:hypothetical protein
LVSWGGVTVSSTDHDAAGSALGYVYQTSWALLELLRQEEDDSALTLEVLDDVVWEAEGTATELIQVKHHLNSTGGLGDMAVDIWRTLNVWMDNGSAADPYGPVLTLVTTSTAAESSAAYHLRDGPTRDPVRALQLLESAAANSSSAATKPWREKFEKLPAAARLALVSRIYVADGSHPIQDIEAEMRKTLWQVLPTGDGAKDAFMALLTRWWNGVSVDLLRKKRGSVTRDLLREALSSIRDRFSEDSLPTLIELEDVDEDEVYGLHGDRVFVHQLNWIRVQTANLLTAIVDYHRAISQETSWLDKDLIGLHELRDFEAHLVDEWRRVFGDMLEDLPADADDETKVAKGRELFRYLRESTKVTVRAQYQDVFFARGKRHDLADRKQLGWHPEFEARVGALIGVSGDSP